MRVMTIRMAVFATVLAALVTGCGRDSRTLDEFVALTTKGTGADYEPLASPREAVDQADLIVTGTLVDVVDGIGLRFPEPLHTERYARSYATFVVQVDRVLDGDGPSDGLVYVSVLKNTAATVAELDGANPEPRVVVVLDDLADWRPAPDVTVVRPGSVPASARLHAAFADGFWLQADGEEVMRGLTADLADLAPGWQGVRTVEEFAAAVSAVTGRR